MNETYDDAFATLTEMLNQNKKEQMIDELLGDTPVNPLAVTSALRSTQSIGRILRGSKLSGNSATHVLIDDPWDI